MKLIHRRRRVDANHGAIVRALEAAGCMVADLSGVGRGCPDLLVCGPHYPWHVWIVEVKNPQTARGRKGLNDEQQAFFDAWKGRKAIVTSPKDALAVIFGPAAAQDRPQATIPPLPATVVRP